MKIHLNFITLEVEHLPADGRDELALEEGGSLSDALQVLDIATIGSYLTLLNETSIPATLRGETQHTDGDTLTQFSPIKGG